jgi:hypothetical protein
MEDVSIFYVHFCIFYSLLPFFYGHLEYFLVIWYFFLVLVCCSKKDLATLVDDEFLSLINLSRY